MSLKLRSTTNLVVDEHLQLPRAEMKANFMYVYNKGYKGLEPVFMQKLWLSSFFPEIANDPQFGKNRKGVRTYSQFMEKHFRAGLLKIKKVNDPSDPHFVVAVPLAEFDAFGLPDYMRKLRLWFLGDEKVATDDDANKAKALQEYLRVNAETPGLQQKEVHAPEAIAKIQGLGPGAQQLQKCLFGLRMQHVGSMAVVFADFKISKEEAQQLTSTEWLMVRNIDMYPLMLQWQLSLWGYRGNAPTSSFPMSKVAKTLPEVTEGQARVNEHGLSISADGHAIWLPEKLDNTQRYEDLYSQVGDKGDDTFGLIDLVSLSTAISTGEEIKVDLPQNIPVLIDWVNNRFAYTQSNGVLKIQDLSRFKAADAAHAKNLLTNWDFDDKMVKAWSHMASVAGVPDKLFFTEDEAAQIAEEDQRTAEMLAAHNAGISVEAYWRIASSFHNERSDIPEGTMKMKEISIEGHPIWRPLARYIDQAQAAVLANMDAVNQKFSVSGTTARLGQMLLIAKYGNDLANTLAKANTICAAATTAAKGIDPNWKMESVPLIMDNPERPFSLLPHQVKVRNIMKDSPDFAILPVQAGGGKTPIAIVDILLEIKANRSQPYLVMCPSALVPQYVKEITYFTSGKVNVIPIATDTIFRNGFDRLTDMIQHAPRNSVVVVNYDVLRNGAYDVCYGTTNVKIYPVIEFLRQFNFGYALMDEAHYLKNDSQRTRAAMILLADIPKKRLASGTMAHDSPSDLAMQIAMLDPTLFGSREDFNKRFGLEVAGGRVIKWRPGAQQNIMAMIKTRIVVAKAMRKEWAALLPTAIERMHRVDMTDAQRTVYETILTEAFERMAEDAKKNPALKKFLEGSGVQAPAKPQKDGDEGQDEEADEAAENAADEDAGEDLAGLLGFYLARIEQFLTAPGKDELGARVLQGDDLISPKVRMILQIIREHIEQNLPGKVLVFTNFIESAEEIYELASNDPVLKASGVLYTAANKVEDGAAFETDKKVKWMVGVENSMNTGLNFQFVSRLIRVENVWNPGTLEQGNSRINRPEMKKADDRPSIYYDWIITNKSIDVTKVARLISKIIAVSKFENTDNPAYENLPDLPVIKMSAESIQLDNDWDKNLKQYMLGLKAHNTIRNADYKKYREQHGGLTLTPLLEAPMPKDAALMDQVPYVPGLDLFKSGEQGLIRVDEYLRVNSAITEEEEDNGGEEEEEGALSPQQKKRLELANSLKGQTVHTEFGDGIVKSLAMRKGRLNVVLPNGYMVRVKFASAFVITKAAVGAQSKREQLLKSISTKMPIAEPTKVIPIRFRVDNMALRKAEKERLDQEKKAMRQSKERETAQKLNIELEFNVSNGFLGISYYPTEDSDASAALQAMGFRPVEPYVFALIDTPVRLKKQFDAWAKAGFTIDKQFQKTGAADAIADLFELLKGNKVAQGAISYRFSNKNQLQNFFRMELRPSTAKNEIKPYPMIENGEAYLVMHTRGQPGNVAAMKVRTPGIQWKQSADSFMYYGLDMEHIKAKMREIIASGIQVANIDELRKEFRLMRKMKIRNPEEQK